MHFLQKINNQKFISNLLKYKLLNLIIFSVFLIFNIDAQSSYDLLFEKNFSSKTGAEDLLTIHKAFYSVENIYLPPNIVNPKNTSLKLANISYRLMKSFVIDYPVDYLTGITQHEVFGHGSRFREFNYTNESYHLALPPPFGKGHGFAEGTRPINSTFDESITMMVSGNESNSVLAEIQRTKWVMDDTVNYRDFFIYLGGQENTLEYTFMTLFKNSGDIYNYINDINIKYYSSTGKRYDKEQIFKYSLINILDPYQFIAFYHWGNYIITGKQKGKQHMIKIKDVNYLPSFQVGLTPFGAEFYMNNYLKWKNRTFKAYFRYGDPTFANFWGAGASALNIVRNKYLLLHASADIWEQPSLKLQSKETNYRTTLNGIGGCISATLGFCFFRNKFPVNLILNGGYKTDGYLQGETLSRGFFVRGGLGFVTK